MFDDTGTLHRIFDSSGFEIHRRVPRFRADQQPLAGLMNFNALHELFNCNEEDENEEFPLHPSSSYNVYPQAGMVSYGHVVSKGLIQQYYPFIDRLTHEIRLDR